MNLFDSFVSRLLKRDPSSGALSAVEIANLAAFPKSNPNPVLQFASTGNLIYFNEAAQAMATSFGSETIADLLPGNVEEMIRGCLASDSKVKCENEKAGRTIAWSFIPIVEIQSVHGYAREITEHLNLEERLRQSQKMESVGYLAAGIAHDFNNILAVIQGHAELLSIREKLSPKGADSLHQMSEAAERAVLLTQQLLAFGRKQPTQQQLIDCNEVVLRVTQMLTRLIGAQISLRAIYSPDLPMIMGDPTMMEQIIMNLSVNARDAMPNGGSLVIGTTVVKVTRAHVELSRNAREGLFVCLNVTDSGAGIAPEKIAHLFEPFFTTKVKGKGTGLGLATVHGIVKQHCGWVEVESAIGKGTTFKVYLPVSENQTLPPANRPIPLKDVVGGKETILLVEDESGVLSLSRNVLKSYGYQILEAQSGPEALRIWNEHGGEVDLLLTDIVLPQGVSGIELANELLLQKTSLTVLFTSGYGVDVLVQDFGFNPAWPFLKKPSLPRLLAEKVRASLDKKA